MKNLLLLIFGLLLTCITKGQDKKISIGMVGSPDIYNYKFNNTFVFDQKFRTGFNYSAGVRLQYNFTNKVGLKTALQYATKGYILDYKWKANAPNDPSIPKESRCKLNYLDIPLMIAYNYLNLGKISLFASTGIVTGFLISSSEISIMEDGSKKETKFIQMFHSQKSNAIVLATELDLGIKFNLNEKLFLTFEPYFRYGLNKVDNYIIASNPTSFGGRFGLHYNLK